MSKKTKNLLGMRFGKLVVIEFAGYKKDKCGSSASWICKCDCGNEKEIYASQLLQGITRSCGCLRKIDKERNNIIGKKFNRLTAIKRIYDDRKGVRYLFRCDCGKEKIILKSAVVTGKTKSCGCLSNEKIRERCFKDLTDKRFGKLVALNVSKTENGKTYWKCKCDCGNYSEVLTNRLTSGHTKSCGCLVKEKIGEVNKSHEKSGTRLYKIYQGMKARCYRETTPNYSSYGGRGITICREWLDDFTNFYEWAITNGYQEGLSIDRIDNNGNYEPKNCHWTNAEGQANNRRTSRYILVNGENMTVSEFAKKYEIKSKTFITRRLNKGCNYKKILEDYKKHLEK